MELELFDLVVFEGNSVMSHTINFFQKLIYNNNHDKWTHCSLILTNEILDLFNITHDPKEVYVIDSTISGLSNNIYDMYTNLKSGIHIRSLNELYHNYRSVGVYKLKNKVNLTLELKLKLKNFYLEIKDYKYNNEPLIILKNIFPTISHLILDNKQQNNKLFCSQLCLEFYKILDLIDKETNSELIPPSKLIQDFNYLFEELIIIKIKE